QADGAAGAEELTEVPLEVSRRCARHDPPSAREPTVLILLFPMSSRRNTLFDPVGNSVQPRVACPRRRGPEVGSGPFSWAHAHADVGMPPRARNPGPPDSPQEPKTQRSLRGAPIVAGPRSGARHPSGSFSGPGKRLTKPGR